jgi:two-component system, response regulator PdtaR
MKVLIVEDEIFVALHLEAAIERLGCSVVGIAPDAPSALELAQVKPDLAFVDLNLRDGPTGVEIARDLAQKFGTKVLILTANPAQAGEPFDGLLGVIGKPWDDASLAKIVSTVAVNGSNPTSADVAG